MCVSNHFRIYSIQYAYLETFLQMMDHCLYNEYVISFTVKNDLFPVRSNIPDLLNQSAKSHIFLSESQTNIIIWCSLPSCYYQISHKSNVILCAVFTDMFILFNASFLLRRQKARGYIRTEAFAFDRTKMNKQKKLIRSSLNSDESYQKLNKFVDQKHVFFLVLYKNLINGNQPRGIIKYGPNVDSCQLHSG